MRLTPVVVGVLVLVGIAQGASGSSAANNGIYKVRLDGTHRTRLFANPDLRVVQDLSPNRKRVLAQYSGENDELYSAAIDGSHVRLVTRLPGNRYVDRAVFSPDGKRIAIGAVETQCDSCMEFEIWLARTNGTGLRRLVMAGLAPSWSPDGRRLAYVGAFDAFLQQGALSIVNTRGPTREQRVRPIEYGDWSDWRVSWSPRGDQVAYSNGDPFRTPSLRVVRATGTHRTRSLGSGMLATWSPRGDRVLYRKYGTRLVWSRPDGRRRRFVAVASDWTRPVSWSPDGRWIAFVRPTGPRCDQVFIARPDGRSLHRLTHEPCIWFSKLFWSRDSRSLIYLRS